MTAKVEPRWKRWHRWPFEPLGKLAGAGLSDDQLGEVFHVDGRTIDRWRTNGLTDHQADRAACRLGLVPVLVWDDDEVFDLRETRTNQLQPVPG